MESFKDPMIARQLIIDKYDNPKFKKAIDKPIEGYESYNNKSESCIDNITVYIKMDNQTVKDIFFSGLGCAISTASTDILCEMILNKDLSYIKNLILNYRKMVSGNEYDENLLQMLIVFRNISQQLNRVKCALSGCVAIEKILESKW